MGRENQLQAKYGFLQADLNELIEHKGLTLANYTGDAAITNGRGNISDDM